MASLVFHQWAAFAERLRDPFWEIEGFTREGFLAFMKEFQNDRFMHCLRNLKMREQISRSFMSAEVHSRIHCLWFQGS
jgi:hypothetical protein